MYVWSHHKKSKFRRLQQYEISVADSRNNFLTTLNRNFKKISLKYGKNFLFHVSFNEYQIHQVAYNPQHLKYTFEKCEKGILA